MIKSKENAVTGGIKRNISYYFQGKEPKRGMAFLFRRSRLGVKRKKPPGFVWGFFKELEFKVFGRTVNQAGFSGIFGCFSDIGYIKYSFVPDGSQAHISSFLFRNYTKLLLNRSTSNGHEASRQSFHVFPSAK